MNALLEKIFLDYDKTVSEYTQEKFISSQDGNRFVKYNNGVVLGKYREKDKDTLKAIHLEIEEKEIKRVIILSYNSEIKKINIKPNRGYIDDLNLKIYKEKLENLNKMDIEEWIDKYEMCALDTDNIKDDEKRGLTYLYYAYKEYCEIKNSPYNSDQKNVKKLYEYLESYSKYNLIPIDDDRRVLDINPVRVYDKSIDKTLYLSNIPIMIAKKFTELKAQGMITEFSVRVSNFNIEDGKNEVGILLEEVERGMIFELSNINCCNITKLYSDNFKDCLWISIDECNITFEELCDDFEIHEDKIVTQVIHMQYNQNDGNPVITHLDHEYIFYSIDEYDERLTNPFQKGEACKRIKSFKIDKSNIPFTYLCKIAHVDYETNDICYIDIPFIYFVLEGYFKHKDLLKEYFKKVL